MTHFFAPMQFETPHFIVRCYELRDAAEMTEAVNSSYEHLREFIPWATSNQTAVESEILIRRFIANYLTNIDYVMGIFALDNKQLLGGTGYHLRGRSWESRYSEVGMWIRNTAANQGLGTRVLNTLLTWGFTDWPWDRIEWRCDPANLASAAVARKAGMQLEATLRQDALLADGTRRDTLVFGILRENYLGHGLESDF